MASITDYARMCKTCDDCIDCPLYTVSEENEYGGRNCNDFVVLHPAEASAIIDKWCSEHPQKTYKLYFKPKYYGHFSTEDASWIDRWLWKREKRKICKANRYNCSECIYHEHLFEGARFCGTKCRLDGKR